MSSASPAGELSDQSPAPRSAAWSNPGLGVRVEQEDTTVVVGLSGEFDAACVDRVEAALERISALTRQLVFDLRGLSFLDVAGLKTILRANERARTEPFDVVVVRPHGLANRVFTLTRVGEQLTMVDQPPGALPAN